MLSSLLHFAAMNDILAPIIDIAHKFGIDWYGLLAQMLSFSIVAYILWRFAFKPILATIEQRQQQIASGLKYAEDMKAQLEQTRQQSAALVKQAQIEGSKVIEESRKTAKEFLDKQQKEAAERANEMIAKTQQAIELEHRKMLEQARGEIARLVVSTTQRVLARELNDAERARYNDTAVRELTNV